MKNQYIKVGLVFLLFVTVTFSVTVWQYSKNSSNHIEDNSTYIEEKSGKFSTNIIRKPSSNDNAATIPSDFDSENPEPVDFAEDSESSKSSPDENKQESTKVSEVPNINNSEFKTLDLKILTQKGRVEMLELNGATYIDIDALAKYYGKRLGWDYEKEQFISLLWGVDVRGAAQDRLVFINGKPAVLDQPVYIIDERTLIPISSLAKELGAEVTITDQLLEIKIRNVAKAASRLFRS